MGILMAFMVGEEDYLTCYLMIMNLLLVTSIVTGKQHYKQEFINQLSHAKRAEKQSIINYAKKHKIFIVDNTDKKAKALREVANSIIQGSSADICKIALNSIYRDEVMRKYDAKIVMSIHDEQIVTCPEQYAVEMMEKINKAEEEMLNPKILFQQTFL